MIMDGIEDARKLLLCLPHLLVEAAPGQLQAGDCRRVNSSDNRRHGSIVSNLPAFLETMGLAVME